MKIAPRTGGLIFLWIMATTIVAMNVEDNRITLYVSIPLFVLAVVSLVFELVKRRRERGS